jgi:hypothetical protein
VAGLGDTPSWSRRPSLSDDQVVGMIRGHLASDHPALLETVSHQDLLS